MTDAELDDAIKDREAERQRDDDRKAAIDSAFAHLRTSIALVEGREQARRAYALRLQEIGPAIDEAARAVRGAIVILRSLGIAESEIESAHQRMTTAERKARPDIR